MGTPVFLKQNSDAASKGPFTIIQVKKLLDQNKIKATALFSLDQKKWFVASKNLPKLFTKYAAELSPVGETPPVAETPPQSVVKEKVSSSKPKTSSKKVKSKSPTTSSSPRRTASSVRPRAKVKKSSSGVLSFILLILVLGLGIGGVFLHRKASDEILVSADKALVAFCQSLGLDVSYELEVTMTLDKVMLNNVHLKSVEHHIDLRAKKVECNLPVLMTMGWFLTDEVKIEQPQSLQSKISGFKGVFIKDGYTYKGNQIDLDFFGSFNKKEYVIDGEVVEGEVLMTLSPELVANFTKVEAEKGTKLPKKGDAYSIKFAGPFKDMVIKDASEAWIEMADIAFR